VAELRGALADLDQAYGALGACVSERETGVDGPMREHCLVTAFDTGDQPRHVTEVGRPAFRTMPGA